MTITLERKFHQAIKGLLHSHLASSANPAVVDAMTLELVILTANALEAADSPLCDCPRADPTPSSWHNQALTITHLCHCTAVIAAQRVLGGAIPTIHGEQCPGCK